MNGWLVVDCLAVWLQAWLLDWQGGDAENRDLIKNLHRPEPYTVPPLQNALPPAAPQVRRGGIACPVLKARP